MEILKFYLGPVVVLLAIFGFLIGGPFITVGLWVILLLMIVCDAFCGEDLSLPTFSKEWLLKVPLYLSLPMLFCLHVVVANSLNEFYPFEDTSSIILFVLGVLGAGFSVMGYGIVAGHELVHETKNKVAMIFGRLLYSMIGNPDFSIEHVQIHHALIGTTKDPATAQRGESVYRFFMRSSIKGHLMCWKIENKRLRKNNQSLFSLKNRMITGYLMCLIWPFLYYSISGTKGVLLFISLAFFGKFIFEAINYIEHYGLTRKVNEPIAPHHSWNCNRRISFIALLGLARHSAHHEKGTTPYWELKAYPDAPQMPHGYLISLLLALIPPLWFSLMQSKLQIWDELYNSH